MLKRTTHLYDHVRGLRGQVWLCAYPNLFITIAPAEWKLYLPYFMQPYLQCVWAGAYLMALHMYFVVRSMWFFLATRHGHKFFVVFEWVMKTEYQGRGIPTLAHRRVGGLLRYTGSTCWSDWYSRRIRVRQVSRGGIPMRD